MESRCKTGMGTASNRCGEGVGLREAGVHVWGYRGFLTVALLFVTVTTFVIEDVHCSITTNPVALSSTPSWLRAPDILTFNQNEVDALNAIFKIWSKENPQLLSLLNWSLKEHPCDDLSGVLAITSTSDSFPGAWSGVGCYAELQNVTDSTRYFHVSVTSLVIHGSSFSCVDDRNYDNFPCGFDGIIGELPSEISNLTNLQYLTINHNPSLTGPVPAELFHMHTLTSLDLSNNSLSGTLPSDVDNPNCRLNFLDLSSNNFSGSLPVSSQGTLFCPYLYDLDLSNNHLDGTFSLSPYDDLEKLDLSYNDSTSILFSNYSKSTQLNGSSTIYMPFISNLNISSNNFNGTFFISPYLNPSIIDLSNNQFTDIIFDTYNKTTTSNGNIFLPALEEIYFRNNNLSGYFPSAILIAPNLQLLDASQNDYNTLQLPILQLKDFNLSQVFITNNKLGVVQYPKSGPLSSYNLQFSSLLFLRGNPICDKIEDMVLTSICRSNETDELQSIIQKSNTKMKVIIATSTSSGLALVLLIMAIYVWRLMNKIKALRIILKEFDKKEVKPNLYSYKEMKLATNNFDKDNKLGEGGFGIVYKGKIFDGTQVAVKKLTMSSNQVLHEFLNEVIVISGLKHRNLVKLKGCCLGDGDQRILVFEYVENNNLAEALWSHGDLESNIEPPCLDWETRFNIIVGIARGLAYLHEELQPPIIHRDIKATNILLDKNYNPKIADFGLAYLFPALDSEASHLTLMQIAGTRGYCSPEYVLQGHVSTALDVYSFGILVLEIVSGRKNIDLQKPSEEIYLREWALKQYKEKATMTLIDPKMEHSTSTFDVMTRVIIVALACLHFKATKRPKMQEVCSMLFGNMPITEFQRDFAYGEEIVEVCSDLCFTLDS